jgi:hypothetical protein
MGGSVYLELKNDRYREYRGLTPEAHPIASIPRRGSRRPVKAGARKGGLGERILCEC